MAKLVNPLHSSAARGKVGGTVYNQCRGINYCKVNTAPSQPRTTDQMRIRALMTTIIREFKDLTAAQQDAWGVYADAHPESDWTGSPIRLTAANAYARVNFFARDAGGAQITDPPTATPPDLPGALAVALATGDISATFTPALDATVALDVRYLGPVSTGVNGRFERASRLMFSSTGASTPVALVAAAAAGRHIFWIRTVDNSTGLVSAWMKFSVDV